MNFNNNCIHKLAAYAHAGSFKITTETLPLFREHAERTAAGQLSLCVLILLAIAYVLPGMFGFGPWKPDEPYMFGLVHSLLESGDWIVPTLAGEPFMEKPPLMVWMAALTAHLSSPWLLPEHGARLAIGVFMVITMGSLAAAARRWWGVGSGRYAVLALMCAVGLLQPGHMLIADIPLLAGIALAFHGWSWMCERPIKGGLLFGTGLGMAMMAKGLLGPGMLGLTAIMLPMAFRAWRTRNYQRSLIIAFIASLPWLLIWPLALYMRSPTLFVEWLWMNNVGRFLGFSVPLLGASHEPAHLLKTIPWFTFPLLPLALLTIWRRGRHRLDHAAIQVGITAFLVMLATFFVSASGRVVYLLPMLIPLAIVAVPAVRETSASLGKVFDWSARILFGGLTVLCWFIWLSLAVRGTPPQWSILADHLPMSYPFTLQPLGLFSAIALAAAWIWLLTKLPQMKARAAIGWASAMIVAWGTIFSLLLPWIDAAKSYQSTFAQIGAALPTEMHCLATRGLGESERGMLHYITGIAPDRLEVQPDADCDALLWQGIRSEAPRGADIDGWRLRWQGSRPGENREHFWVYVRTPRPMLAGEPAGSEQN